MDNINDDIQKPWYQEPWLWLILSPLIVVVLVSMVTVTIAVRGADDVVKGDYQKEGRAYTKNSKPEAFAQAKNISSEISFDWSDGEITVEINQDRQDENLTLDLIHPASANSDYNLDLVRQSPGKYVATIDKPSGDRWYLRITARKSNAEVWRIHGQINFSENLQASLE